MLSNNTEFELMFSELKSYGVKKKITDVYSCFLKFRKLPEEPKMPLLLNIPG